MELACLLAEEEFCDRPRSVSPVIGGFLRTYNDGIDDRRRQDLYACAARVVNSRRRCAVEGRRVSMCLDWAARWTEPPALRFPLWARPDLSFAALEAAGVYAAGAALKGGPRAHREAVEFVDRLARVEDLAEPGRPHERDGWSLRSAVRIWVARRPTGHFGARSRSRV